MTYREKLQMEHPEKVDCGYVGGCDSCPNLYGYEDRSSAPCIQSREFADQPMRERCTKCWDRVIPGTEDNKYKNLTRDELIEIIKHLENTIELEDKQIIERGAMIRERDLKIHNLEKDLADLKKRNDQLTSELASRIVGINQLKDKIDGLNVECKNLHYECKTRDKTIEGLEYALRKSEATCNAYKLQATQKTGCTCCCKADVISEKDKEIKALTSKLEIEQSYVGYFRSECRRLAERTSEQDSTIYRLEKDLEAERKEHAKHHGFFARFN